MIDFFADKLIRLRTEKGLTQRDLAALVGVSWSQISKYESGKSRPRKKVLWGLEEALDCKGELSRLAEGNEIAMNIPAGLYAKLEKAASDAGMSMDEYGAFFLSRLVSHSHDELLGIRPPLIFSADDVKNAQARMKDGEREEGVKRRLKEIADKTDDEAMILAEIRERQKADGRVTED